MMIRQCIICKKRKNAYHLLRFYIDPENVFHFCALQSYKPSIKISSEKLLQRNERQGRKPHDFAWLCIDYCCIKPMLKKPKRHPFYHMSTKSHLIHQLIDVFSHEFYRYMNHLYRQGGKKSLSKAEIPDDVMKDSHFIFLQTNDSTLQINEIKSLCNTKNQYEYQRLFWQKPSEKQCHISLYDQSGKQKHKNRRQRIQTILEIWAKLRYID